MKRFYAILLVLAMLFSLAACGGNEDDKKPSSSDTPPSSGQQTQQPSNTPDPGTSQTDTNGEEKEALVNRVGDTVEHGSFEGLSIEWLTLAIDEENEKALLVAKDIIAYWAFNADSQEEVTWENSDIREWLNSTFYNGAFTDEQKADILETEITNPANPGTNIGGGVNTVDRVFLLSYDEAQQYFPTDEVRVAYCNFTEEYAANLAKMIGAVPELGKSEEDALADFQSYMGTTDAWWLRTSGNSLLSAAGVSYSGELEENRNQVWSLQGIRPAIWVNLSDEVDTPAPNNDSQSEQQEQEPSSTSEIDYGEFGDDWPENEFTKLIPKPEFELTAINTTADRFAVVAKATVEQIKDYAEKVKAAGFSVDPQVADNDTSGMVMYTYTAANEQGYTITVNYIAGSGGINMTKP